MFVLRPFSEGQPVLRRKLEFKVKHIELWKYPTMSCATSKANDFLLFVEAAMMYPVVS